MPGHPLRTARASHFRQEQAFGPIGIANCLKPESASPGTDSIVNLPGRTLTVFQHSTMPACSCARRASARWHSPWRPGEVRTLLVWIRTAIPSLPAGPRRLAGLGLVDVSGLALINRPTHG